jgi:glycine cleavage system aminomethyltransferase T
MSDATTKSGIDTPLLGVHRKAGAAIGTWFGCALPDDFGGDWLAEYRAARESVALIDKNYRAYLRFSGPDRVRVLNAIMTNNIKDLATGDGMVSLFLIRRAIQAESSYATEVCFAFRMG